MPFWTQKLMNIAKPPAGLEDFADYTTEPGAGQGEAAQWTEGRVPEMDDGYFPTIAEQDAVLVHWDRPPADENPQAWWDDRTVWQKQQGQLEQVRTLPYGTETGQTPRAAESPYAEAPTVDRPTAHMSPSSYSYTRPYDQASEHELNGVHMSMATNQQAYQLGNMSAPPSYQNSYRSDPPTNDTTAFLATDDQGQAVLIKYGQESTWSDSYAL
jgi:hypothetical protein